MKRRFGSPEASNVSPGRAVVRPHRADIGSCKKPRTEGKGATKEVGRRLSDSYERTKA